MASDVERIAALEQQATSSEKDRKEIWESLRDINEIKVALGRILERMDTDNGKFQEIKGDLAIVGAQIGQVRDMIPKHLEERLAALEKTQKSLEETQKLDSMKVAMIWTGSVALAATAVTFLKDWISHTFWK